MNEFKTRDATHSKRFRTLQLRTKIVLGILLTGGVVLGVLALFAYNRAQQITELLSNRLEKSVGQQAEEQLASIVAARAEQINNEFSDTADDIVNLANYRVALEKQSAELGLGAYWDAHTKLFQLPAGQYGNSASDMASVFIPSNVVVDEALLANLNTTAYLDFSAPDILKAHDSVIAVYFIDTTGATTHYPNTDLANILPPDFDATSQIFFKTATPLFDPQRTPRWTFPYQDPTGTGLVVTVSVPVYISDQFKGVIAADLKLDRISAQVEKITVGQTGYAFLIDDTGHIIAMPPAGYTLYNIQPEKLEENEFPNQTVIGKGSFELQSITRRITAGGTGLLSVQLNGVDTYIASTRIDATKYGLALVVPVAEMNTAVISARTETQKATSSTFQLGALVLIGLFGAAFIASIGLSQIIASPVINLTKTAEQITAGDLNAKAVVETDDEIGRLANAFNTMTSQLQELVSTLEQRIAERTTALERRSTELETVAEVARDIASYRDLDTLLSVTVDLIRERFDFYHAGIFINDDRNEYAVLRAASGIAGQKMLEDHHKLGIGETGIVGYVTGTGQPRITLDVDLDTAHFQNPLLPDTRSEIALPLRRRKVTIGALDIQSREPNAFNDETIKVFLLLADQLVSAIENVQLMQQVDAALQELNTAYQTQTQQAWQRTVQTRGSIAYEYDGLQIKPVPHEISSKDLTQLQSGKAIVTTTGHSENEPDHGQARNTLLAPLMLLNQIIGVIGLEQDDPNYKWTDEDIAIVEAAARRAALSLENARLLEEAQRRASKERVIGEISTKIGSVVNIDSIIETAVRELGRTMPDAEVAIQFQSKDGEG
ncbi:MAG: GAF domain-containing protein [Anaerolineales bacterium]|nr:GAF domain-containing protein [Anaerolineales bacterium]